MLKAAAEAEQSIVLQVERVGGEDLLWCDLCWNDLLAISIPNERLDGRAVGLEAKGQWVATTDHFPGFQDMLVIGCGWTGVGDALEMLLFRRLEGAQQGRRYPGVCRQQGIFDNDQAMHREN